MQAGELAVMAYNPTDKTVDLHLANASAANDVWSSADFTDAGAIDHFAQSATAVPMARNISSAALNVQFADSNSTSSPLVAWVVQLAHPDGTYSSATAAAAVRAPGVQ